MTTDLAAMERAAVNLHRIPAVRLGTTAAYDARQRRNGRRKYPWSNFRQVQDSIRRDQRLRY